ncbi:MAG: hypothetical protein ACR2FS_15185 [Phormidesmis sp.]
MKKSIQTDLSPAALTEAQLEQVAARVVEALSASDVQVETVDWSKVKIDVNSRRISQSGTISGRDYAMLRVASLLMSKGVAHVVQTAIIVYLRRNARVHLEMLDFVASNHGLSREEAFQQIYDGAIKP